MALPPHETWVTNDIDYNRQMDKIMHQLVQMQGTVLTSLLEQSRIRSHRDRSNRGQDQDQNGFSLAVSINSSISATTFEFDQEALNSPTYRQAFRRQPGNIEFRPLLLSRQNENSSLRAVASLPDDDSYFEHSLRMSSEISSIEPTGLGNHPLLQYTPDEVKASSSKRENQATSSPERTSGASSQTINIPTKHEHTSGITFHPEAGEQVNLLPERPRNLKANQFAAGTPASELKEPDSESTEDESLDLGIGISTSSTARPTSSQNLVSARVTRRESKPHYILGGVIKHAIPEDTGAPSNIF
jgi:hypothetical protein